MMDIFYSYRAQIIFFAIFMAAAVPILYYYQRRNPNPRFRPSFGEMSLVTLLAMFACGVLAFLLGGLFDPERDWKKMSEKPSRPPVAYDGGDSSPVTPKFGDKKKDKPSRPSAFGDE